MNRSTSRRHFHVSAEELLFGSAVPCVFLPTLTLDGIAVTPHGQHHLILTLAGVARFYMGPDDATVTRRIEIFTAALRNHIDTQHASFVGEWIQWSWESLLDELVAQLTTGL